MSLLGCIVCGVRTYIRLLGVYCVCLRISLPSSVQGDGVEVQTPSSSGHTGNTDLGSWFHSSWKGTEVPREMADPNSRSRKVHNEPGICVTSEHQDSTSDGQLVGRTQKPACRGLLGQATICAPEKLRRVLNFKHWEHGNPQDTVGNM